MRVCAAALLAVLFALPSHADEVAESELELRAPEVDNFTGAMTHSMPFKLPGFRGLVPALGLSYNSQRQMGLAGWGWNLSGFPVIQRAHASGRGYPSYESTDGYKFGGERLLACQAGWTSPSCTTGGTHALEKEDYRRYQHVEDTTSSLDRWYVWRKDGTRETYSSIHTSSTGTYRTWKWGLTEVQDTRGNTVSITWAPANASSMAYPASISYNGVTVTLYWENTTYNWYIQAAGTFMERQTSRLKSVDVKIGANRLRAYKLTYTNNANGDFHTLATLQEFGSDCTVDGTGTVSGGTSLPPTSFTYSAGNSTGAFTSHTPATLDVADPVNVSGTKLLSGDFNGDGQADLLHFRSYSTCAATCLDVKAWISQVGKPGATTAFNVVASTLPSGYLTYNGSLKDIFRVGDFDADGIDDLLHLVKGTTESFFYIWFFDSNGQIRGGGPTSFTYPHDTSGGLRYAGDFNGDGKLDLVHMVNSSNHVLFSNGDGTFAYDWSKSSAEPTLPTNYKVVREQAADVNGDGKDDLVIVQRDTDTYPYPSAGYVYLRYRTQLSDGAGLFTTTSQTNQKSYSKANGENLVLGQFDIGDFNGDGNASDLRVRRTHGSDNAYFDTYPSYGNGAIASKSSWLIGDQGNSWYAGSAANNPASLNGDGLSDYINFWNNGTISKYTRLIAKADATFTVSFSHNFTVTYSSLTLADFNGDGKTDIFHVDNAATPTFTLWLAPGPHGAKLVSISNGLGGVTDVTYAPSSAFANTNNPPIVYAVTSVTRSDGRGWSATTSYSYAGGLYDYLEKRFLGFRYVQVTPPKLASETEAPCTEAWYKQDYASFSKPEEVKRWSGACGTSTLLSYQKHEYTTNSSAPYTSLHTGEWQYDYHPDGSGQHRRTYSQFEYDAYANLTLQLSHGDYDMAGDERREVVGFAPNTSGFIVGLPAYSQTWSGLGGGVKLAETLRYYDGASSYSTPPTVGNLTQSQAWLDQPASYITSTSTYDGMGNVTSATDPLGAVTASVYDSAGLLLQTTNALGHVASIGYDSLRRLTSSTDANGKVTTTTYDALSRLTQVTNPVGHLVQTSYESFGSPTAQRVLTKSSPADGTNWVAVAKYFDGLGHTYRMASECPSPYTCGLGSGAVYVDTTYNARGNPDSITLPYKEGTPAYAEVMSYDALDRVTRMTHADSSYLATEFFVWATRLTDEVGSQRESALDAYGNLVRHSEKLSGAWHHITYSYDLLGHRTRVVDPLGNTTTYSYDSLGRQVASSDPDLGASSASYNASGFPLTATDAKSQVVETVYDLLGRSRALGVNRPSSITVTVNARTSNGSGAQIKLQVDGADKTTWITTNNNDNYTWNGKVVSAISVLCPNCSATTNLTVNTVTVDGTAIAGNAASVAKESAAGFDLSDGLLAEADGALHFSFGEGATQYDRSSTNGIGRTAITLDKAGWSALSYDAAGRPLEVRHARDGVVYSFKRVYDVGGRMLGVKYPDGDVFGKDPETGAGAPYTYDITGRIKSIPGVADSITYNTFGRMVVLTNSNGTQTTFTHEPTRGFLTNIKTMASGGTCPGTGCIQNLAYTRDAATRVSAVSSPFADENWSYQYDELGRLTSAAPSSGPALSYSYDVLGNILSANGVNYSYPATNNPRPHAVTAVGASSYTYDANGNMLSGGGRTFTWDAFNRPVTISQGEVTSQMTYGLDGIRAKKVVGSSTTTYIGGDYEVTDGVVTKLFKAGGLTIAQKQGTTLSWLHSDLLGTIQARTDASGTVLERQAHEPYGEVVSGSVSSAVSFTSERRDVETGLMYLNARYYDSALARFVSADPTIPTGRIVGLNHYAYASNNPASKHDKSGLQEDNSAHDGQVADPLRQAADFGGQAITTASYLSKDPRIALAANIIWAAYLYENANEIQSAMTYEDCREASIKAMSNLAYLTPAAEYFAMTDLLGVAMNEKATPSYVFGMMVYDEVDAWFPQNKEDKCGVFYLVGTSEDTCENAMFLCILPYTPDTTGVPSTVSIPGSDSPIVFDFKFDLLNGRAPTFLPPSITTTGAVDSFMESLNSSVTAPTVSTATTAKGSTVHVSGGGGPISMDNTKIYIEE